MNRIKIIASITVLGLALVLAVNIFIDTTPSSTVQTSHNIEFVGLESSKNREVTNAGRYEYFHRLLKDPVTKQIPKNIRAKELAFLANAKNTPRYKGASDEGFSWTEIGPNDIGGRTRAFAVDSRNSDIMIAGGASGGIWKTTNGGDSWAIRSEFGQNLGVSSVVQDPTEPDVWYYSTAEFFGSAASRDQSASFYGSGMYRSVDNGDTWAKVDGTEDDDVAWSSQYDFVNTVAISPTSGTIFFASNPFGVFRSPNDLANSGYVLGAVNNHIYSDVAVNANGVVIATLSMPFPDQTITSNPGVYISTNDGLSWTNITPGGFPDDNGQRSVIGVSESDPDVFYTLTDTGAGAGGLKLFKFDISNLNAIFSEDRTSGIPNFGGDVGSLDPQGGYNLLCKVHPDNADIVFIGGTNLFRSTDGFSTVPPSTGGFTDASESDKYWIGGYSTANNITQYASHHPDQHNLVFDPVVPNKAYSTHDGGISVTDNILASPVVWRDVDDGYNVTQFYTVSIHPGIGDQRIAGGTQDNGSPFFRFDLAGSSTNSVDLSSGDGAWNHLGTNYALTSAQNGFMLRYDYTTTSIDDHSWSYAAPKNSANQLFIHPFAVNPSNEDVMFYPEKEHFWRNNQMTTLPRNTIDSDGTTTGWTELSDVNVGSAGHEVTSLAFSSANPSHRLYYGGSHDDLVPVIRRLDNANTATSAIDISIPGADQGSYIHDIAVNPQDGDELIVVVPNYNATSLWYSSDAGANWTDIGGSLEGSNGPSVRTAAITPSTNGVTYYFAGTSVGLFYTSQLEGNQTVWTQVGEETISNSVIAELDYRLSDNILAVATHGRGIFLGEILNSTPNEKEPLAFTPGQFELAQNYPNPFNPATNIRFTLGSASRVRLSVYDLNGRKVASIYQDANLSAGTHETAFDASNLASGSYLYRLETFPVAGGNGFLQTKTMTLIK